MLEPLTRYARPLLITAALLLVAGVMLTLLHMLVLGWAIYAIGHVLATVGFLAVTVVNRDRMDSWTWFALVVLEVGLIGGVLAVVSIGSAYAAPTGATQMALPADALPIGLAAELVTWVGLAFFGLAARGAHVLPRGIGWVFLAAAVIGVLGDFRLISPLVWVLAVLLMAWGLLGIGVSLGDSEREGSTSSA
jgi:hypothetical protein